MEKDKFLDAMDKTEVNAKIKNQKLKLRNSVILHFAFCILLFFFLSSCSLPRIIVLEDPLTPEEHINLGVAYEKKGETGNAIEEYKKASKNIPAAFVYLGNAYMQKGDLEEAERYYRKAIKKQPDLSDAYNNLAWLYYTKKEKLREAESLVLKALELSPSNETYQDTLSKIRALK